MPKLKSFYRCQECGYSAPKGLGQCPDCSVWNSMIEEVQAASPAGLSKHLTEFSSQVVALGQMPVQSYSYTATGLKEFDRLLGGGVVPGQVSLLAGPPGIGKSTLMLQVAASLASQRKVLYISGEESLNQVSSRCARLGLKSDSLYLLSETDLLKILTAVEKIKPWAIVMDSVQTVFHPELDSSPGSVSQVRESSAELLRVAKRLDTVVFLLGHITKDGTVAGPKVLEHIVDTVLIFDTERHDLLRVLRAQKNRFGPTDEVAMFEMREQGMKEILDPAVYFISDRDKTAQIGRAFSATLEGSRPMLVEVQSLVVYTKYPLARRMATGLDLNRLHVLLAAMEKHLKLRFEERDVYASLAGGMRLKDPALDLAVCMAVASSLIEAPLPPEWVMIGEVGLLGDISRVPKIEGRLREAARAGFTRALVAQKAVKDIAKIRGIDIVGADSLSQAAAAVFEGKLKGV